jgi:hypothetical protein
MALLLTSPRQVRLVRCTILSPALNGASEQLRTIGFDISPYVQQIDIYESIFDNTLSGKIVVLENVGLTEYLPLVGVEVFSLVFEIDDPTTGDTQQFARAFRIVSVKDQSFPRHDFRLYTIHLVTDEFVRSVSSRVCRAFHGTCAESVREILTDDLGVDPANLIEGEDTEGTIDITIPNYTPLMAINYFTVLAQTKKTPRESNFLFFETLKGFHFTSISQLIEHGVAAKDIPTFQVNPGQMTSTEDTMNESKALNSLFRVHQEQSFDLLFDIAAGTLRSKMVTFDFLARQVSGDKDGDSRYTDSFKATTHLDRSGPGMKGYPVYPENFDLSVDNNVRIFTVPTNTFSANSAYIKGFEQQSEQRMHEAIVLRNRQLREIKHIQTLIDLPGQPGLRAGTVVVVNYPSTRFLEDSTDGSINKSLPNNPTPYYSGNHLVTAVHHILTTKGPGSMEYRMNVKVNKDSFGTPLVGFAGE